MVSASNISWNEFETHVVLLVIIDGMVLVSTGGWAVAVVTSDVQFGSDVASQSLVHFLSTIILGQIAACDVVILVFGLRFAQVDLRQR